MDKPMLRWYTPKEDLMPKKHERILMIYEGFVTCAKYDGEWGVIDEYSGSYFDIDDVTAWTSLDVLLKDWWKAEEEIEEAGIVCSGNMI